MTRPKMKYVSSALHLSITLPVVVKNIVDQLAGKYGVSRSAMIAACLAYFIESNHVDMLDDIAKQEIENLCERLKRRGE